MTFEQFSQSLANAKPPQLSNALLALWWDGKGDWHNAHEAAQSCEGTPACDWVHAYLHRKEGDAFNAGYWYRRARKPVFAGSLQDEWQALVQALMPASDNRPTTTDAR